MGEKLAKQPAADIGESGFAQHRGGQGIAFSLEGRKQRADDATLVFFFLGVEHRVTERAFVVATKLQNRMCRQLPDPRGRVGNEEADSLGASEAKLFSVRGNLAGEKLVHTQDQVVESGPEGPLKQVSLGVSTSTTTARIKTIYEFQEEAPVFLCSTTKVEKFDERNHEGVGDVIEANVEGETDVRKVESLVR